MSYQHEVKYTGDNDTTNNNSVRIGGADSIEPRRNFLSFNIVPVNQSVRPPIGSGGLFISTSSDFRAYSSPVRYRSSRSRRTKNPSIFCARPIVSPERSPNSINLNDRSSSPFMDQLQKFMEHGQTRGEKRDDGEFFNQPSTSILNELPSDGRNIMAPLMLQSDTKFSSLKSTRLLDQLISCFVVGGECRLCLQQMQALVLPHTTTREMDDACQRLRIVNTQANKEQIQILRMAGSLPPSAVTCELITKSNAERLIARFLMNGSPPLDSELRAQLNFIQIAHDCFGGCIGRLYSSLAPNACIECATCLLLFQPESFCRHTHPRMLSSSIATTSDRTDRLCHWGFDSSNWAYYLHIDDGCATSQNSQDLEEQLANFIQTYRSNQNPTHPIIYTQANA